MRRPRTAACVVSIVISVDKPVLSADLSVENLVDKEGYLLQLYVKLILDQIGNGGTLSV